MTPRRLIEPARLAGSSLLRTQTDARLVDLVRAGHASAFEAIVQRYRKPLLAYCSRVLPPARAEDAVQQAFLNAYQAMVQGDAELNLRPWLYRIAHNASLNLLRQNGWTHEQLDDNFDGVERPDQALERREELRTTLEAVKALPERQRDAVVLRELEGMRYDEIAVALGVGDGAVRQLLHRARTTLRAGMSSVIPAGLIERVALAAQSGDPTSRIAEVAGGVGGGLGMVKLGAALLATGVLATGAATAPIVHHSHASRRSAPKASEASAPAPAQAVADRPAAAVVHTRHEAATPHHRHRGHGGSGHSGEDRTKSGDHGGSGSGDSSHSGSGSGSGDHSGSGSGSADRSGSGDRSGYHSGSGSGSGSGELSDQTDDHSGDGSTTTVPTTPAPAPTTDGSGDGGASGGSGSHDGQPSGDG